MSSSSTTTTPDPFGRQAEAYAVYRPDYPAALMEQVLARLKCKGLVLPTTTDPSTNTPALLLVDVCTGSGQVLRKLAGHFTAAQGFDRSVAQLGQATQLPNVTYAEADACALPVAAGAAAVVTVAQAMHWLNIPRFMQELERVLRPGGMAVVLGYPRSRIPGLPEADAALLRWYDGLEGYWDPRCDRHLLDAEFAGARYAPLVEVGRDRVEREESMTPARLGAYLRTWSAYNAWKRTQPSDGAVPDTVDALEGELAAALSAAGM
jgi:ubiquinone/menaquinone biosynthesis C-methylase UbiE